MKKGENQTGSYVETKSGRLFVNVSGEGNPLLLIHGVGTDAEYYHDAAQILARSYRVMTYDRPGYSRSASGTDGNSVEGQTLQTAELIDALSPEGVRIAASSAGCLIAYELAARRPEKLKGLLLYEPPITDDPEIRAEIAGLTECLKEMNAKRRAAKALMEFVRVSGGYDKTAASESLERLSQNFANFQHFLDDEMESILGYTQKDLPAVCVPITVAAGDMDVEGLFNRCAVSMAKRYCLPLVTVHGYHNFPKDRPGEFAKLAEDVFRSI